MIYRSFHVLRLLGLIGFIGLIVFLPSVGDCATATPPSHSETSHVVTPSLYDLSVSLTDQDAKPVSLDTFRGHPTLISMVYASCPATCPLIISTLQKVDAALSDSTRANIRVLLVSLDPEHDTPELMNAAFNRHHVDLARWRFAVASPAQTRDVAAVLGVKYRTTPKGDINHNAVFTVLDRDGRIVQRFEGLNTAALEVAQILDMLAKKTSRATDDAAPKP